MHPQAVLPADPGDAGEVVDRADVGRPRGRDHGEEPVCPLPIDRRRERLAGHPAAGVRRDDEQADVHHGRRRGDRRVRLVGAGHAQPCAVRAVAGTMGVPGGDERRQVADRAALHEAAGGRLRESGQAGQPLERLVLGVDRARRLHPRPGVDRRRADDEVEHHRELCRRSRDERQEARVVDRDDRGGEHVGEEPHRGLAAEAVLGDRGAGEPGQLVGGLRPVERHRVQPQAIAGVLERGPGDPLGLVGVAVHRRGIDDVPRHHISRRPARARPSVTSSAYSRSPPTGSPLASRVTRQRPRRRSAR